MVNSSVYSLQKHPPLFLHYTKLLNHNNSHFNADFDHESNSWSQMQDLMGVIVEV